MSGDVKREGKVMKAKVAMEVEGTKPDVMTMEVEGTKPDVMTMIVQRNGEVSWGDGSLLG